MKQKTLIILAATSVLTAAVAAVTLTSRDSDIVRGTESDSDEENLLFPGLLEHLNEVTTVTVKRKVGEATLTKSAHGWGLAEKGGFPIEPEPVRKMLLGMGQMKKIEAKTSDPSRYAQLGLQDPDAEGSKSALITLKDAGGKDLAQLVLGKDHESKGALSNQRYVRLPASPQTWLVQGTFDVKEKAADWLDKKILEVKRDRVRTIEITQADGELLVVDRPDAKTSDFQVLEIPEGKELTYPTAAGGVAGGLEYVNLEDVEPVEKVDFTGAGPIAKFKTFDGLVVTVTMKDQDGKTWAKFDASYEAPPAEPTPPATDAATPPDPSVTDPNAPPSDAATPPKKSPEEVAKEVADFQARHSKWAYQIQSYTRANLGKKKSELLKDKAPPPAPVDPNAPMDPNAPEGGLMLPDTIPLEIQEQIKAHQDSVGGNVHVNPSTPPTPPEPAPVPKPDVPKPDAPKPDAPKPDAPKPDGPQPHPSEPPH